MKGKELDAVKMICAQGGAVPLADLALKLDWELPCDDLWGSLRTRLNAKFGRQGWTFYRGGNQAKVKRVEPSKRTPRK